MSEEILRALMQLFAIIAKQDDGVVTDEEHAYVENFLLQQINADSAKEYMTLFDQFAASTGERGGVRQLTSVKDSVRILGICKKINKTLTQKQKVVVLLRLFELVNTNRNFSEQRMGIIDTVAEVFKVSVEEYNDIKAFVEEDSPEVLDRGSILFIDSEAPHGIYT